MQIEHYIRICRKLNGESQNGMTFRAAVIHSLLLKEQDFLNQELKKNQTRGEAEMICACLKAISETLDDITRPPKKLSDLP